MSKSDRRARLRLWVLGRFGDGEVAPCAGCGKGVDTQTMTLDRYPLPGRRGGRYTKGNVRPMCAPCNNGHVDEPGHAEELAKGKERSWLMGSIHRNERPLSYRIKVVAPESLVAIARESRTLETC